MHGAVSGGLAFSRALISIGTSGMNDSGTLNIKATAFRGSFYRFIADD